MDQNVSAFQALIDKCVTIPRLAGQRHFAKKVFDLKGPYMITQAFSRLSAWVPVHLSMCA
jgi:hypothetical protein